jgi:PAS domain S-box-containing protein
VNQVNQTIETLQAETETLKQRVAELEHTTAALRRTEAILRAVVDAVPGYIFVKDRDFRYILANQEMARGLGTTPDTIPGKDDWEVGFPEELILGSPEKGIRGFRTDDQAVMERGEYLHNPYDPATVDDGVHIFDTQKIPLYEADGQIFGILGIARDVTRQKQAEEAQRRLEYELQQTNAELEQRVAKQTENLRFFQSLVENSPDGIGISDLNGVITYANSALKALTGYGDALVGMSFVQLYPEDEVANVEASVGQVMSEGTWTGNLTLKRQDGTTLPVRLLTFVMYNSQGQPASLSGMFHDLTSQQQAEQERETLQQQIIDAQRLSLRELSTPLIPLSSSVVLMPLIGSVDTARAQQVMETLLEGIAMYQADTAILDITGVSVVDTQVANALIQTAQAVRLLGAQVVLTGIGPVMAQTLVHLGADLSSIVTRGSLQNGIAYALSEEGSRRERGSNGA